MSIKTILISQPEPTSENSPYSKLIRKYKLKIDYRPFIHVEGLTAKEVRAQKVDFSKFQILFLQVEMLLNFFRITEEMRFKYLIKQSTFVNLRQLLLSSKVRSL